MTTPPELAARVGGLVRKLLSLLPASTALAKAVRRRTVRAATRSVEAAVGVAAAVGSTRPLKILVLSLATLAAGGLGLMVAYAATPDDGLATQVIVTNGETYTVATITGPSGTTTVAVTKTKAGKTKLIPVRVTRTVDGPGETERLFFEVAGESVLLTETDTRLLTQIVKQIETETHVVTEVSTQFQPVTQTQTEFVNHTTTIFDTTTVFDTTTTTVTETVPLPAP
ncbi:MAG: hypothetical protein ACRDOS_08490 [Gaiellaceae bacterium]